MQRLYKQAILCSVFVLAVGLAFTAAKSQAATIHKMPGMAVIARAAHNAAVLIGILKGEIPKTIEQDVMFPDATGWISTYQPGGSTTTSDNAFFSSDITKNGRTCFACHQPECGWAISPPQLLAQLCLTRGRSILFQPIDAADCPNSHGATARFPGSIPFFSNLVTEPDCPGSTPGNPATCDKFITTDPGKGLVTGLCKDLGKMKVPILRGLASRAPYFHGGNAAALIDVVNFYNLRFDIRLTDQEKKDLVNYLNSR